MKIMSTRLSLVRYAVLPLLFALALMAGASARPAIAAGPQIGDSCGGTTVPNAYCSFYVSGGANVVIGSHSCNVVGSCLALGNGSRIGDNSCNASDACAWAGAGVPAGSSSIGSNSCNASSACFQVGVAGRSTIGANSCNGGSACTYAGFLGTSNIGSRSCNGPASCESAGNHGTALIGLNSCNGTQACSQAGFNQTIGVIGSNSCNGNRVCYQLNSSSSSVNIQNCTRNTVQPLVCRAVIVTPVATLTPH